MRTTLCVRTLRYHWAGQPKYQHPTLGAVFSPNTEARFASQFWVDVGLGTELDHGFDNTEQVLTLFSAHGFPLTIRPRGLQYKRCCKTQAKICNQRYGF